MKLGFFTSQSCSDAKEMYKQACCTCRVVVLPIQPIPFLTLSLPSPLWHLKVPIKWTRQRMAYYRAFSLTWPVASAMHPRRHRGSQSGREKGTTKVFTQGSGEDGSYANLSGKKEVFTPTGLVWDTNMAAVLLLWDSSMTDVTFRENSLLLVIC